MKPPNNGADKSGTGHHLSLTETYTTRNKLHLIELLVKGVPGEPTPKQHRLLS